MLFSFKFHFLLSIDRFVGLSKRISRSLQKTGAMDIESSAPSVIHDDIDLTEENIFGDMDQKKNLFSTDLRLQRGSEQKRRSRRKKSEFPPGEGLFLVDIFRNILFIFLLTPPRNPNFPSPNYVATID